MIQSFPCHPVPPDAGPVPSVPAARIGPGSPTAEHKARAGVGRTPTMTPNVNPQGGLPPGISAEANVLPYLNARTGWAPSVVVSPGGGPGGDGGDFGSGTPGTVTQGINEALQSVASTGGVVVVQRGSYAVKATITIPTNVTLVLQGATLTAAVSLPNMVVFKPNATVIGFGTINGNRLAGTVVFMATGGRVVGSGGVLTVANNAFGQPYFAGITLSNCTDVEVSHVTLIDTALFVNGVSRGAFTDIRVQITTNLGANPQVTRPVYIIANAAPSSYLKFARVHVEGGGVQNVSLFVFNGGQHAPIQNCSVTDCSFDHALDGSVADGLDVVGCDSVTVTGCFGSRVCDGISVCGSTNVTLTGNVMHFCSAAGISLADGSILATTKYITVTGNICVSNGTKPTCPPPGKAGITSLSKPGSVTSDLLIVGNICGDQGKGTQQYGVYLDGTPTNVVIAYNNLHGNGTAGYAYAGTNATVSSSNNLG